jgi:hypothetical protein
VLSPHGPQTVLSLTTKLPMKEVHAGVSTFIANVVSVTLPRASVLDFPFSLLGKPLEWADQHGHAYIRAAYLYSLTKMVRDLVAALGPGDGAALLDAVVDDASVAAAVADVSALVSGDFMEMLARVVAQSRKRSADTQRSLKHHHAMMSVMLPSTPEPVGRGGPSASPSAFAFDSVALDAAAQYNRDVLFHCAAVLHALTGIEAVRPSVVTPGAMAALCDLAKGTNVATLELVVDVFSTLSHVGEYRSALLTNKVCDAVNDPRVSVSERKRAREQTPCDVR